jgi:hypothetical protein
MILAILIGLSQIAMAFFYLRPKALASQHVTRYRLWKPLLIFSILIVLIGIITLSLPENLF